MEENERKMEGRGRKVRGRRKVMKGREERNLREYLRVSKAMLVTVMILPDIVC